jgi:hypothetical protein
MDLLCGHKITTNAMLFMSINIIVGILNEIGTCICWGTLLFQTIWQYIAPFMGYVRVRGMSEMT